MLNAEGIWPFNFSKPGRFWNSNSEINIASLDPDGNNLIMSKCMYWQEPVGVNALRALEKKAMTVSWKREQRKSSFVLFGCNSFTEELREIAVCREDLLFSDNL